MATVGIVPAAGAGSRFAAAAPGLPIKVLVPVDGEIMVRRAVRSLLDGGADRCVVVVSREAATAVAAALTGFPVSIVVNPDPSRGMFSSIQCGVAEVDGRDQCILLPGDMPYVQPATVSVLLASAQRTGLTVSASHGGRRGHPIALSAALVARIREAPAGTTLSSERSKDAFLAVEVADPGVLRDVDVPGDLGSTTVRQGG